MVPAILLLFSMFFLPESPRWLARKDRWEDCHAVLTLVHGKGDPDSPFVLYELNDIREMCQFEARNSDVTYWELLKPNMLNRTHIGVFTQIWSQLTGMNVMMYYITYVFGMAGYSGSANLLASSIQYIINVVMTVPALIWLDRWGEYSLRDNRCHYGCIVRHKLNSPVAGTGRRKPLVIGAFFMMVWMFANAGIMAAKGFVSRL